MGIGVSLFIFLFWAPRYYRIQLHHLTPNSFVHISIFMHLCEAFLGIEPHFELFRFLFHLKLQPDSFVLDVVTLGGGPQPGGVVHLPNPRGWLLGEVQTIRQIYL